MATLLALCSTPLFAQNPGPLDGAPNALPLRAEADDAAGITKFLGPLAENLLVAFSMDRSTNGSIVFTRPQSGLPAIFLGGVKWVNDGGHQCTSFAGVGATCRPSPSLQLGASYTLSTWMKLPCPGNHAVVWHGARFCPLFVAEDRFACSSQDGEHTYYTEKNLTGWHHVAVTCDGARMTFFLDGVNRGQAPTIMEERLVTIGTKTFRQPGENTQCDCLDDMFIFDRTLKQEEIAQLTTVRLPIHEPTPADIALQNAPQLPPGISVKPMGAGPGLPDFAARKDAANLVKAYRDSLVFVSGENGSGSGFLAKYNNAPYLFTNAHVAAGVRSAAFKTLDGTVVKIGATSAAAVGHDVVLMQAAVTGPPFEIMLGVDKEASIGDSVVVLGNAEGAGVVNTIMGKIVGIGPNLVEVDAPFLPGNSGSPIIHLKSGKVIGVATYLIIKKTDTVTKEVLSTPTVRRFGYRLDSIKAWQSINWSAFAAQANTMENIEGLTKDLIKLVNDIGKTGRITSNMTTNAAIKNRIDAWHGQFHTRMSQTDKDTANKNFLAYLKTLYRSDVLAAHTSLTYDYFQRKLTDEERDRNALADIFAKAIQSP